MYWFFCAPIKKRKKGSEHSLQLKRPSHWPCRTIHWWVVSANTDWINKLHSTFSHHIDGANTRCFCGSDGFAALWPGEPGRVWVRHAASRGQTSLLWDHTHGCNEGSSKFTGLRSVHLSLSVIHGSFYCHHPGGAWRQCWKTLLEGFGGCRGCDRPHRSSVSL